MSKQQHLQKLAIAVLAGSALTAWQLDHTANAAVKPTQVTSQLDSQKQVNVILKKDGQPFAYFWIKGKPGEEAKFEIGELSRDYLWQNGDHVEKMPPRLTIPTKEQTIVLAVVSRNEQREVTKDVFLTIEHCDLKGRPLSGCEDEHYHYQVTTSYVYDLFGKQNLNIQYKLSGATEVVPQTIAGYQLAMPGRVKLSPDGLIGDPEKRVVFLDETTPFKITIRANYLKVADDKHDQQSSERPADAEKEQENQQGDHQPAGSATEKDQPAEKDSSKDEQVKDPQESSTEQPVDTPKDQDAADDKQGPSTDQPTNTPTDKSEDQPDDEVTSEDQDDKERQEPSTAHPVEQPTDKSEDLPVDEDSSKDHYKQDQQEPATDQPVDTPTDQNAADDKQSPSTDQPANPPADKAEDQPAESISSDESAKDHSGDDEDQYEKDQEKPTTGQPVDVPSDDVATEPVDETPSADLPAKDHSDDEVPSETQHEKDQQEPSTEQPVDQPADKTKDHPADDSSTGQHEKGQQEPTTDQPVAVPDDKEADKSVDEEPSADRPVKEQPGDEASSETQHEQEQQESSTEHSVDKPADDHSSAGQQQPDHSVDTPADSHGQQTGNESEISDPVHPSTGPDDQKDNFKPSTPPEHQEGPISDQPAGQPTDEELSTDQLEKDQEKPSTDQPVDVPDDQVTTDPVDETPSADQPAKAQPGDKDLPKDQQEKDQQESTADHPVNDPTDNSAGQVIDKDSSADHPVDTTADSHDQQTGEKQEDSTPDPSTPSADQEGQFNPSTLPEHQEQPRPNLPAEQPAGDDQQPRLPGEPSKPEAAEDNQPALPKKEVNQQSPSTNGTTGQQNDDERQERHGEANPDQDRLINRKKTADNYLNDDQEKINELDRQVPPQSANDQLPQTGDNEQGRLIAAISGLVTGLIGLASTFFAWKKN